MTHWRNLLNFGAVAGLSLIAIKNAPGAPAYRLVNVSNDPTRELYQALNPLFVAFYEKETGRHVFITQSHGGSSRQARRIIMCEQSADVGTPDPRTSGNGKLAALAAWAAVVTRGGNDDEARAYLHSLYQHVPALEEGARAAAISFAI